MPETIKKGAKDKPGVLGIGATSDVATWQKIIGITPADGNFGPMTEVKTKEWQKKNGLEPTGIVGPATWAAATSGVIRLGSKGNKVKAWQKAIGMPSPDGNFGTGTEARTKEIQSALGVKADGIVGPATWGAATIKEGSRNTIVKNWQKFLGMPTDGNFGAKTAVATREFQKGRNMSVTGIVGPATWEAAAPFSVAPGFFPTPATPAPVTVARPTIRQGSSGEHVAAWQRILGVTADGKFGPQTAAATRKWQSDRGLTADGVVGPKTWSAAGSSSGTPVVVVPAVQGAAPRQASSPGQPTASSYSIPIPGRVSAPVAKAAPTATVIKNAATAASTPWLQQALGIAPSAPTTPPAIRTAGGGSALDRLPMWARVLGILGIGGAVFYVAKKNQRPKYGRPSSPTLPSVP
jgi:peptidoglycan hydrolase-like protein with peptidoglycan-binding domain